MMVMHTGGSVASTPEATEDMQRAGFMCRAQLQDLSVKLFSFATPKQICMHVKWKLSFFLKIFFNKGWILID